MARNGSGTYNRAVSPYTAGTTITAATVNSEMDDIATALTGSMARDGQSPATANIPMGGFRITGLGNAIANTDAAALGQVMAKAGDTATGALGVIAGTAAAPGVFVSGDTNTGLFQPAADTLAVTVGGAEVARFGANGLQSAAPWVDLASATTTDIGAQTSNNVRITGTTTITSLGTAASGVTRQLRFAGALTLTHNATSLILPGGANIVTMAGDTATAISLGSGNWVVVEYTPAALWSWQMMEPPRVVTSVAQVDFALPTAFRRFRISFHDATVTTAGQQFRARFSSDGGATFLSAANYVSHGLYQVNVVGVFHNTSVTSIDLTATISSDARAIGAVEIFPGGSTAKATLLSNWRGVENSVPIHALGQYGGVWDGASARMNALRIFAASGNVTGTFILEGLR